MARRRGPQRRGDAGPRSAYDTATRERAIDLAEEHGAAEASRRLGIPQGTIRRWRHQTGRISRPPDGVDREEWVAKKREGAAETWRAARSALDRVHALLEEGDERGAKDAALTMAILVDKSAVLEQASALAIEQQAKLTRDQGIAIAAALSAVFDDLGILRGDAINKLVAHHLRALSDPDADNGLAPTAADARAAVRSQIEGELERKRAPVAELLPPAEWSDDAPDEDAIDGEASEEP